MKKQKWWWRPAVLAELVNKSPGKPGRTVMMKLAYLLQTIRNVPLGYHFELYNYGPYDNDVLSDLSQAATLDAIDYQIVNYPSGHGYQYSVGVGYDDLRVRAEDELAAIEQDIDWVVKKFGDKNASRLELYSTIVFADREIKRKKKEATSKELARRVHQIKPHFSEELIEEAIEDLADDELVELLDD